MSQTRYLKNMITPTKVEPTTSDANIAGVASGVWSTQDQLEARRGGAWPDASVADPDTLIESNFSTFLYTGDGNSGRAVTTGIDSVNKSSLIWIKRRDDEQSHGLFDTLRGVDTRVESEASDGNQTLGGDSLQSFTSTGFTVGSHDLVNGNNKKYVSWSFKKAPKFFDVVKYEGTGSARTVAHSLGGTVGMILIKNLDQTDNWAVYHRGADASAPEDKYIILNTSSAVADSANWWNDTAPTTSVFTVGTDHAVNANGENYIAYIFAHETGSDSMIQCGSYIGNGNNTGPSIDLGWEPQWLLLQNITDGDSVMMFDTMRGFDYRGDDVVLLADTIDGETNDYSGQGFSTIVPTSTGFNVVKSIGYVNNNNSRMIYVAIRRPNMATITDATKVFDISAGADTNQTPFPVDMFIRGHTAGGGDNELLTRLLGNTRLDTNKTSAEAAVGYDAFGSNTSAGGSGWGTGYVFWNWKVPKAILM